MKTLPHAVTLSLLVSCLAACSDKAPPETGKAPSTEPTVVKDLHDPIDRAKGVSTLLQNAAEANQQEMEKQTQ